MLVLKLLRLFFKHLCYWFCVHGAPKRERHSRGIKPEQAPLLASTSSTEQRGLYQLLHLTNPVRIQRTIWLDEDNLVFVRRVLVLFDGVCSTGFCSIGKFRDSSTFEDYILIPTGSKSFGQGTESHAGLSHVGLSRIILWSRNLLPIYFEDHYLLRSL